MRQAYLQKNFRDSSLLLINCANEIIEVYQNAGFSLTLRQLYYQFVSRDLLPNKQSEYKRLGSVINDARLAGFIDWDTIEDRTRNLRKTSTWDSPADILHSAAHSYKSDAWAVQDNYVEVWIEKDALVGVIEPICEKYRVPYFACRGYSSQSEQWAAGKRLAEKIDEGKKVTVFHLGDHDPSGIDMSRDNEERLRMFINAETVSDGWFELERLALNMEQIRKYRPPPNPAKLTDSRIAGYLEKYGAKSWELDALDPKVIGDLISKNIESKIDFESWNEVLITEGQHIDRLKQLAKTF